MKTLIDFKIDSTTVANPDGTLQTSFTNATIVPGPGRTNLGQLTHALDLGTAGKAVCNLSSIQLNANQFCINIVFNATKPVLTRQNLAESNFLPFSIYLTKGATADKFNLVTSLKPKNHNWSGPDTMFKNELALNRWYSISLVYDYDTAALFINDALISVHAFPQGTIDLMTGKQLFLGTWVNGIRDHFNGLLAAFQLYDGIPENLENQLDAKRNHAEWAITYKNEAFKKSFNIGERTRGIQFLPSISAYIQYYEQCAIMYHYNMGVAFEMHGAIYNAYKAMRNSSMLGYLVSDELNTTRANGKKSLFSKGGLYWSSASGVHSVFGQIYAEYENTGESKTWGFPTKAQKTVPGGFEQEFQSCRFYYREGAAKAHEVHGAILEKFLALGGVVKWGFPVSNESDIKRQSSIIGKFSEFETCTIYWKSGIGAFEVHGDIRAKYLSIKGPLSDLGFPTSDESNIPGVTGAKANSFEQGSILWYGNYDSIIIAWPFNIRIGRLNTEEDEGWTMGQNDLYFKTILITQDGKELHRGKRPESGYWSDKNIVDVNYTIPVVITPNKISTKVSFYVDIWEHDDGFGGSDQHMGKYIKELNLANAWGLRENNGIYSPKFSKVKSMGWSIIPKINITTLTETEKWWGKLAGNRGTPKLTYDQYASAFKGVDSEPEIWDVTDWIEKAFFYSVVEGIAKGGNCFGMSLEGINSRKQRSIFSMPINKFNWAELKNEFNIKQAYQVGADPIWWFVGQFLTGNTHNPVDVFNETQREFNRGNNPVLCLSQNYDFSGKPHCLLPVKWDKSSRPWKMTINDPNSESDGATAGSILYVDPAKNTFSYSRNSTAAVYKGGRWDGGRMHYMPYSLLSGKQRLIVWELLLLLLSGTILILADDGETVSITDTDGNDLSANSKRANDLMKEGKSISPFFVGFSGFESSISKGNILLRREDGLSATQQTNISSADPAKVANAFSGRNFIHTIKGKRNGKFNYMIKTGFNTIELESELNLNESHKIEVNNLGTNFCNLKLNSLRTKDVKLKIFSQLGANGDYQGLEIKNFRIGGSNDLEINIKQGIGGIEILNKGPNINLNVNIATRINKVDFNKNVMINLDKGIRVMPSSFMFDKVLQVRTIDKFHGKALGTFRF